MSRESAMVVVDAGCDINANWIRMLGQWAMVVVDAGYDVKAN